MKIFIFKNNNQVSERYHSDGGLVIIAKDKRHANKIISVDKDIYISEDEWKTVEKYDLKNDQVPKFWVMPNAGCC